MERTGEVVEKMDRPVRKVLISGYYGFGNSGDEAVLLAIIEALRTPRGSDAAAIEPVVLSADPDWTSKTYGVQAVHRMKIQEIIRALKDSDGLISGGGSLLQDTTGLLTIPYYLGIIRLAQVLGKPTFVYAQGIGPVERSVYFRLIRSTFDRCRYISVRDGASAELLAAIGVPRERIEVVPDPVLGLSLESANAAPSEPLSDFGNPPLCGDKICGDKPEEEAQNQANVHAGREAEDASDDVPLIGVSVRFWNEDRSDLDRLAAALRRIGMQRRVRFLFLPFHVPDDEEACVYVMEQLAVPAMDIVRGARHPLDMLAQVGRCDLLIGMRLHSLIYAANQCVPLMGVSYDPKVDRFLHQLKLKPAATTEHLQLDFFTREALLLIEHRQQWREQMKERIDMLKRQAQKPAQQICQYFRI
jgi:polysaccharide pyruvyl transferase CsaB